MQLASLRFSHRVLCHFIVKKKTCVAHGFPFLLWRDPNCLISFCHWKLRHPKRTRFMNLNGKLTSRLCEFRFCRNPRRPSFPDVDAELIRRLCASSFCSSPVLPARRRPLQFAELCAQHYDCTRKPIDGLTQLRIPITGSSFIRHHQCQLTLATISTDT